MFWFFQFLLVFEFNNIHLIGRRRARALQFGEGRVRCRSPKGACAMVQPWYDQPLDVGDLYFPKDHQLEIHTSCRSESSSFKLGPLDRHCSLKNKNTFVKGRRPQIFVYMEDDPKYVFKWKTTLNICWRRLVTVLKPRRGFLLTNARQPQIFL